MPTIGTSTSEREEPHSVICQILASYLERYITLHEDEKVIEARRKKQFSLELTYYIK
jgi:hypothetical protein